LVRNYFLIDFKTFVSFPSLLLFEMHVLAIKKKTHNL
jgi:hypothetical protein